MTTEPDKCPACGEGRYHYDRCSFNCYDAFHLTDAERAARTTEPDKDVEAIRRIPEIEALREFTLPDDHYVHGLIDALESRLLTAEGERRPAPSWWHKREHELEDALATAEGERERRDEAIAQAADDLDAIAPTWHGAGKGQLLAIAIRLRDTLNSTEETGEGYERDMHPTARKRQQILRLVAALQERIEDAVKFIDKADAKDPAETNWPVWAIQIRQLLSPTQETDPMSDAEIVRNALGVAWSMPDAVLQHTDPRFKWWDGPLREAIDAAKPALDRLESQNQALKGLLQEWLDDFDAYPASPDLENRTSNALAQETDPEIDR
jgi:hypothetical protein